MSWKQELHKLNLSTRKTLDSIVQPYQGMYKLYTENTLLKLRLDQRTKLDDIRTGALAEPSMRLPRNSQSYDAIESVYHMNGTIKRCVIALREEVFRNGYSLEPKYKVKCVSCGQEYDHKPESGNCDNILVGDDRVGRECNGALVEPDIQQKKRAEEFLKCVNANWQDIIQVLKEDEDDVNKHDDAWVLLRQDYLVSMEGDILKSHMREIIRASPKYMRFSGLPDGTLGGQWKVCLVHRDKTYAAEFTHCPICGRRLHDIIAFSIDSGKPTNFYIHEEIIHYSKYSPSLLYGFSPICTLWDTAVSLIKMVEYIYSSYDKKRTPAGVVAAKTRNLESLRTWWKAELDMLKKDKDHIPIIGVDPDGTGGLEFVKFSDSIAEMQFRDVRDEFKREIGAVYGVEPFFLNDSSQGGGLNNEGLQITVTNRAVAAAQGIYNDHVLPRIMAALGVTDWLCRLKPSEEKDEAHKHDLRLKEIQIAQGMAALGFDVDMDDEEKFKYTKKEPSTNFRNNPFPPQAPMGFSGQPDIIGSKKSMRTVKDGGEDARISKGIWENALKAIEDGAMWGKYKSIPEEHQKFIHKLLRTSFLKGPKLYDVADLIKQIVSKTGVDKAEAERIVRTEEQAVVNKSRELYWKEQDPQNENVYRWQGPGDNRTTKICAAIKRRTKEGVSLAEMQRIVAEEATNPDNLEGDSSYEESRPYTPHINCRHTFTRMVT